MRPRGFRRDPAKGPSGVSAKICVVGHPQRADFRLVNEEDLSEALELFQPRGFVLLAIVTLIQPLQCEVFYPLDTAYREAIGGACERLSQRAIERLSKGEA